MTSLAIAVIFPFAMLYAATSDLVSMTIANRVSVLLALAFPAVAYAAGFTPGDIGGSAEGRGCLANEGAGDDPSDIQRINVPPRDRAELVEPLQAEMGLVGGDLQDAVGGGVEDRLAGGDALLAQLGDDRRPGGVAVAENAGNIGVVGNLPDQRDRKGRHCTGEIAPVEGHRYPGDLPMPGRGVLAARDFAGGAPETGRRSRIVAACDVEEAETAHVGQNERTLTQPGTIGFAGFCTFEDVPEGVGPGVAECLGILRMADPEGIEDNQNCARQVLLPAVTGRPVIVTPVGLGRLGVPRGDRWIATVSQGRQR